MPISHKIPQTMSYKDRVLASRKKTVQPRTTGSTTVHRIRNTGSTTPTVQGKGYIGTGKHKVQVAGKMTKVYRAWAHMLERCYSELFHERQPTYKGTTVCREWLNFQVFAEWFKNAPNSTATGFQLDKDLILPANREYSPAACSFVPAAINSLFNGRQNDTGLPTGVPSTGKSYRAILVQSGKAKHLGTYSTAAQAHSVYAAAKELQVQRMAEDYQHVLDSRVYQYLIEWTVPAL